MKKALITVTTLAVLGATVPRVEAGDKGWATAGKVMAGVGAGLLIAKAFEPEPVYVYSPPPVYVQPVPVVITQPAPVVVQQPQVVYAPAPVVVQQPVIYQPAPVVYQPAPVVVNSPVYVVRPPAYCPPPVYTRPVVGFHFSIGHSHRHHGRHH